MLFTVYDPKGEMFEVTPPIAKQLIIDHGWSVSPPNDNPLPLFSHPDEKGEEAPAKKKA